MNKKILNALIYFILKFFREENDKYLVIMENIYSGVKDVRRKLQELMKMNMNREDLAKLKEHEFYLDLDELEKLHKEADAEIQRVRKNSFKIIK